MENAAAERVAPSPDPPKKAGPKKLNDFHMQMLHYILQNPGCTYEQVAAALSEGDPDRKYTIGWISQIYNSDAFQAMLAEHRDEVFGELKLTLKDRMNGVAHQSFRRLGELIPVQTDVDKVANVADLVLKGLGYGQAKQQPAGPSIGQQNIIVGQVDAQTLAAARELMNSQKALPSTAQAEGPQLPALENKE